MKRYLLYLVISLLFHAKLHAQHLHPSFQHITKENHLPAEEIRTILPAGQFLFIGTDNDVYIYDGVKVSALTTATNKRRLFVTSMLKDKSGNIWIGSHNGLFIYTAGNKMLVIDSVGSAEVNYIQVIEEDTDGNIWLLSGAQNNLLLTYNPEHRKLKKIGDRYEYIQCTWLKNGKPAQMWFKEGNRLYRLDFTKDTSSPEKTSFVLPAAIHEVQLNKKGEAIVATSQGIYHYKNNGVQVFMQDQTVSGVTPAGDYWICSIPGKGLVVLHAETEQVYRTFTERKDDEGSLSGDDVKFTRILNDKLYVIHETPHIDVAPIEDNCFELIRETEVKKGFTDVVLFNNELLALGGDSNIYEWKHEKFSPWPSSVKCGHLRLVSDTLYGLAGNMVYRLNDGKKLITPDEQPIYSATENACCLYINTTAGNNFILKGNAFTKIDGFRNEVYLRFSFIVPINEKEILLNASYSYLLLATKKQNGYERTQLIHLVEKVNQIIWLNKILLIVTAEGIYTLDPAHTILSKIADSGDEIFRRLCYTENNEWMLITNRGVKKIKVNHQSWSIVREWFNIPVNQLEDKNMVYTQGKLWIPHSNGMLTLIEKDRTESTYQIAVSHVRTGGTMLNNVWFNDTVITRYRDNEISMDVSISSTFPENGIHLKYFLNKTDSGVTVDGNTATIYFKDLSPGNYLLTVEGLNNAGQSIVVKNISIQIKKEWYQTMVFYAAITLLVVALFALGILIIIKNVQKKARKKEEIQTRIKESENLALRSQMNPHFIFNTLNSINHYIMLADLENASLYLHKFSKLIRNTLDLTRLEKVTLEREIENLKLYIEIEQARTGFSFDYTVRITNNVDTGFIRVPPLIIQPFAENAIWHGIKGLSGRGMITIDIQQPEEDLLLIIITDNGVGRKDTEKKNQDHKSHGMEITAERLTIWDRRSYFSITDLKTDKGLPAGTQVTIHLYHS